MQRVPEIAMDKYPCFSELTAGEPSGSFAVCCRERPDSRVIVIAPHGGAIEVHTSEIARRIAGRDFSYYAFEGRKARDNRDLHITSHRFDEPTGTALVARHRWVCAVHGCAGAHRDVLIGGLDAELKTDIAARLGLCGINTVMEGHRYLGTNPDNICNRGARGCGVQLELTMAFRVSEAVEDLVAAVREVLLGRGSAS